MFDRIVLTTTGGDQGFALDNLTVDRSESVPEVPEPASLSLLGLALVALAASRKRRR